jgi:hypothetical protein
MWIYHLTDFNQWIVFEIQYSFLLVFALMLLYILFLIVKVRNRKRYDG